MTNPKYPFKYHVVVDQETHDFIKLIQESHGGWSKGKAVRHLLRLAMKYINLANTAREKLEKVGVT